jgi:hypothetical protein
MNGGQAWTKISPDLAPDGAPANAGRGAPGAHRRPAVSALALSYVDNRVIWAGTDDGRVQVSRDSGTTWANASPAAAPPGSRVAGIETSHFDPNAAYVVLEATGPVRPHILRTRDSGQTWIDIVTGLPPDDGVGVIREDSARRGLLFAATDQSVFLSFDDGNTWQSLRLNLPPTPVRSLLVRDTDLIVGTGGRGFWILDDLMPLRQITDDVMRADAFIFRPPMGWRTRTPPGDDPAQTAGPDTVGVPLSYVVGKDIHGPVTIEIIETLSGELIRRFSSDAAAGGPDLRLPMTPGLHRVTWDVRYAPPPVSAAALAASTRASGPPPGRWASAGTYQVRFTVSGRVLRQAIAVKLDPRVRTSGTDLAVQARLSKSADDMLQQIASARAELSGRTTGSDSRPAGAATAELDAAAADLIDVFITLQAADVRPTAAVEAATNTALARATAAIDAAR